MCFFLKEISVSNMESVSFNSDDNFLMDEANQKLNDYMDEVISQYLLADNPESCCKKLENMLMQGLQVEQSESKAGKLQLNFRLHPLNYVSLNAYTTLASAYKIRSINLLSLCSDTDECHWESFDMSKTSAAYSLLLASATDHLFQSESSLIASAANFWVSAGESLFTLGRRSSLWNLFVKPGLSMSEISLQESKCTKCSLQVDSFILQAQSASLKNILNKLCDCISNLTGKVWSSLIHGCHFLQTIQDPTDFSSIDKSISDFSLHSNKTNDGSSCWMEESISKKKEHQYTNEERVNVSLLGVHCLFYGGYLANICYGEDSHLTCHIKNVLYDEEKSVH